MLTATTHRHVKHSIYYAVQGSGQCTDISGEGDLRRHMNETKKTMMKMKVDKWVAEEKGRGLEKNNQEQK